MLLTAIVGAELFIMFMFGLLGLEHGPVWVSITDALLLGLFSSILIYAWLIRPLQRANQLEQQASRLAKAVEQAGEAICIFNAEGRINFVNPAFRHNVGCEDHDVIDMSIWNFWDPADGMMAQARGCVRDGKAWSGKHRRRRVDGNTYEAVTTISPVAGEEDAAWFSAIHRDITAVLETERQLAHAQKMEAIGTLAGGIAHDFNNVLSAMLGNLFLVLRQIQDKPELVERVKLVEQQGYRAAETIRQLLAFARSSHIDKKPFALKPFFMDLLRFMRPGIPENIELDAQVSDDLMRINGDSGQMQQVILNLVTNAHHAIEDKGNTGGRIGIHVNMVSRLACCTGICAKKKVIQSMPNHCVEIRIEDNGIGMDKETRARIFDPYFTTKARGRGTGLGLPMIAGYVDMHGGCMDVQSRRGVGSVFRLWIPPVEEKARVASLPDDNISLIPGGGELILVADDNMDAARAMKDLLTAAGYRVATAADGEAAIRVFQAHAEEIRLAVLDVVMPRCGGVIVAHHIREARPDITITLMTGYDIQDTLTNMELSRNGGISILRKPWNISQLNGVLRQIRPAHQTRGSDRNGRTERL